MFQILNIFSKTFLFGCYSNKAYLTLSYAGGGGAQSARANFKESYLRIFISNFPIKMLNFKRVETFSLFLINF